MQRLRFCVLPFSIFVFIILMQVARNLGKTLREFQPTIKELQVDTYNFEFNLHCSHHLWGMPDATSSTIFPSCRKFQRNLRAPLKRRLVLMRFQVQYKIHTGPEQLTLLPQPLHQMLALRILGMWLTLVSIPVFLTISFHIYSFWNIIYEVLNSSTFFSS